MQCSLIGLYKRALAEVQDRRDFFKNRSRFSDADSENSLVERLPSSHNPRPLITVQDATSATTPRLANEVVHPREGEMSSLLEGHDEGFIMSFQRKHRFSQLQYYFVHK